MTSKITRAAAVLAAAAAMLAGPAAALTPAALAAVPGVNPATPVQLCETSGFNCLRDANNGGAGSPVVEAACDCPGPAENVQVISGGSAGTVKISFTGHSGQCVALDTADTSSFVLGNCSTAIGTVMIETVVNGGLKFEDRYASQHRGGHQYLTALGEDGAQFYVALDGGGFQRFSNCTGSCV